MMNIVIAIARCSPRIAIGVTCRGDTIPVPRVGLLQAKETSLFRNQMGSNPGYLRSLPNATEGTWWPEDQSQARYCGRTQGLVTHVLFR